MSVKLEAKTWNSSEFICDTCKGKPDFIYFDAVERKVLSIICLNCRNAVEATILSIAKAAQSAFGIGED